MKTLAYLLLAMCLISCAHINPNPPTEKFCQLEKLTAKPQVCIPDRCYGKAGCADYAAGILAILIDGAYTPY